MTGSFRDADATVMQDISHHVDQLISLGSMFDTDVQSFCVKFQIEHASNKAEYQQQTRMESREGLSPEMDHLRRVLTRMIELASSICQQVLRKTYRTANNRRSPSFARSSSERSDQSSSNDEPVSSHVRGTSVSSVDDLSGEDFMLECGANLMHSSLEVLSLALVVHPAVRSSLQSHLLENCDISLYLNEALRLPKEQELSYFAEGYKTDHMKLIANLAFEHRVACKTFSTVEFLTDILNATKQDDDNPGMSEWAEFALRNICSVSEEARDRIKSMKTELPASR